VHRWVPLPLVLTAGPVQVALVALPLLAPLLLLASEWVPAALEALVAPKQLAGFLSACRPPGLHVLSFATTFGHQLWWRTSTTYRLFTWRAFFQSYQICCVTHGSKDALAGGFHLLHASAAKDSRHRKPAVVFGHHFLEELVFAQVLIRHVI